MTAALTVIGIAPCSFFWLLLAVGLGLFMTLRFAGKMGAGAACAWTVTVRVCGNCRATSNISRNFDWSDRLQLQGNLPKGLSYHGGMGTHLPTGRASPPASSFRVRAL
jgi:hypothetical protein